MKEMNAAANHSSLFTGSFSKPLLAFQLFGRAGGGELVNQHALGSSEYKDDFTHLLAYFINLDISIFACSSRGIKPNSGLLI